MSQATLIQGYIPTLKSDVSELYIAFEGGYTTDYKQARICSTTEEALKIADNNNQCLLTPVALPVNGYNQIVRNPPKDIEYVEDDIVWDDDSYLDDWDY